MQPENQPGNPIPPAPQAPQPSPPQPTYQAAPQQPLSLQEQVAQSLSQPPAAPQPQVAPPPQTVAEPVAVQPLAHLPPEPIQEVIATPAPEVLGGVAVADQVEGGYGYEAGEEAPPYEEEEIDLSEPVTWQAKEFIHQEKGATWFIIFAVVIAALIAVAIFLMDSPSFAILLVVIAVTIVVLSKRPPRVMEYSLSEDGLHIDSTTHKYDDFKSFGVIRDGEEYSIMLIPRRRFLPGITVYFPEEAGEDIVDVLGSRLPMRDLHLDVVDKIVRKLRL